MPAGVEQVRSPEASPGDLFGLLLLKTLLFVKVGFGIGTGGARAGAAALLLAVGQLVLHPGILVADVGSDHPGLEFAVVVKVVLAGLLLVDWPVVAPVD